MRHSPAEHDCSCGEINQTTAQAAINYNQNAVGTQLCGRFATQPARLDHSPICQLHSTAGLGDTYTLDSDTHVRRIRKWTCCVSDYAIAQVL